MSDHKTLIKNGMWANHAFFWQAIAVIGGFNHECGNQACALQAPHAAARAVEGLARVECDGAGEGRVHAEDA